jgi:DNA polymerase-3 subunit delta'
MLITMEQNELSFATIIGHERPVNILKRALANHRLAHAYLFSGMPGVGKKLTALALAAGVNCRDAGTGGACGACPSCRKAASGGHPDIHLLASGGDEIKIDQIRQIQADLSLKPFEGSKKTLIVDGAENMNTASANAFLKTLEEPPGDALIILITAQPHGLLPTIRSRCQEIRFLPLSRRALAKALVERRSLSEEDAWFLAALAQGSMGRGLEMDIEQERAARKEFMELRGRLPQMTAGEILAHADAVSKDREQFERLLETGVEWLRDVIVMGETGDETLLVNDPSKDGHRQWAERLPLERLLEEMELLSASRGLLDRRVSGQLVAENLLMKLGKG